MKKIMGIIIILALLTGCTSAVVDYETGQNISEYEFTSRYLVAVLNIEDSSENGNYNKIISAATGRMISQLSESKRFRIIERNKLNSILEESKLALAGITANEAPYELGKILGVDAVVVTDLSGGYNSKDVGNVGVPEVEQTASFSMESRVIVVKTGEILSSGSVKSVKKNRYQIAGVILSGKKLEEKEMVEDTINEGIDKLAFKLAFNMSKK